MGPPERTGPPVLGLGPMTREGCDIYGSLTISRKARLGCAAVATAGPRRKLGQSDLQQNLGVEIDWDYEFIDQEVNYRIGEDLCNIKADVL